MRILAYIILAILFIALCIIIAGCSNGSLCDHSCKVEQAYKKLKPPIVLIGKKCSDSFGCSVVVRDSRDTTLLMGNMSSRGNIFGASYNVGDTIK